MREMNELIMSCRVAACSGGGFGSKSASTPKKQQPKVQRIKRGDKVVQKKGSFLAAYCEGSDVTVEKAVRMVEKQDRKRKTRKIDPEEAARGSVDYVQVKDWGGGDPEDLDNLEIDSFSGDASASGKPFYEQMAKHLELLQAKGALRIAQDNLPDFKNWSFKESRFLEYLEDQRHVHCIIEDNIADLIANPPCGGGGPLGLAEFSSEKGLDRAAMFAHDIEMIMDTSNSQGKGTPPRASLQTIAYGKYISQLHSLAVNGESDSEKNEGCCRLIAHAYSIRVNNLSTATRIGATATEKLDLFPRQGNHSIHVYPDQVSDPMQSFIICVNKCGRHLSFEEKDWVLDELAASFKKTALLLTVLAHED